MTQPDRRRGRGGGDDPSPVKQAATELGIPVLTPERAREVDRRRRARRTPSSASWSAFGQLLPPAFLDALPHGFVNVHFSLLPRWRGAAPVERAILAGDAETGVCVMRVEEGLDTGRVYASAIDADRRRRDRGRAARAARRRSGRALLVEHLPRVPTTEPVPQEGEPTYAAKLTVDEFRLDRVAPGARARAASSAPGTRGRARGWSSTGSASRSGAPGAEPGDGEPGRRTPTGRAGHHRRRAPARRGATRGQARA